MIALDDIPLKDAPFPWFIMGGWALDLFMGRQTREHQDIDLGVFRSDQFLLQEYLSGWSLMKIDQFNPVPWLQGEKLLLPIHEIHARNPKGEHLEFLLAESDHEKWIYRRNVNITALLTEALLEISPGFRVLSPEIVLLFKSKKLRDHDKQDFENIAPLLSDTQSKWLLNALSLEYRSHEWIGRLEERD